MDKFLLTLLCFGIKKGDLDGVICDYRKKGVQIDEGKIKNWAVEILEGLDFLHTEAKVIHLDIKPANVLLDAINRVKIGDLGVARNLSTITSQGFRGTPCYVSPQLIKGEKINEKTDIW
jgi:serine/threonine protein kinase